MRSYPPATTGSKTCTKCGEVKDVTCFGASRRMRDGRHSWCKPCVSGAMADHYHAKKDDSEWIERKRETGRTSAKRRRQEAPEMERARYLKSKYGLTAEAYDAMLVAQGGLCATARCVRPATDVDHDHSCCPGKRSCGQCVRSLLCNPCNMALGLVGDDPALLADLIDYLAQHSAITARNGQALRFTPLA